MEEETVRKICPFCKEERDFIPVIAAWVEEAPFTMDTPIGSHINRWVEEMRLPLGRCPECNCVVFIGPSPKEVARNFKEEERKSRDRLR